jgi:hypothetical protein
MPGRCYKPTDMGAVRMGVGLLAAWGAVHLGPVRFLVRPFVTMWLHELGHAITGWLAGLACIPGPWVTLIPEERSWGVRLLVWAGAPLASAAAWQRGRRPEAVLLAAAALLSVWLAGTLKVGQAQAWVTFGGDGGALVLGALLMATPLLPPDHALRRGGLHLGLSVLGALAWADVTASWWGAHLDLGELPFGEIEGVGLSDASKLVDQHGWPERLLVRRYLLLSAACAAALLAMASAVRRDAGEGPAV